MTILATTQDPDIFFTDSYTGRRGGFTLILIISIIYYSIIIIFFFKFIIPLLLLLYIIGQVWSGPEAKSADTSQPAPVAPWHKPQATALLTAHFVPPAPDGTLAQTLLRLDGLKCALALQQLAARAAAAR